MLSFFVVSVVVVVVVGRDKENPTQVNSLFGKNVVFVAAGASYSAAVTTDGLLYTWGKGTQGRLGHGKKEGTVYD